MFIIELILGFFIGICLFSIIKEFIKYKIKTRRFRKVSDFRISLYCLSYNYAVRNLEKLGKCEANKVWDWFANKWSYDDMLYSDKPLTLAEWYTAEEINKINL